MSDAPYNRRRLIVIAVEDYGERNEEFTAAITSQVAVVTGWWTSADLDEDRRFELEEPKELLSVQHVRTFLHEHDLAAADDDDALVVYITGHGEKGDSGRHYLRFASTDMERLPGTALTTSEVISAALGSRSEHVLIMVDSCFAGSLDAELASLIQDFGKTRCDLRSLAVVTAGNFEDSPTVGSFTALIDGALEKIRDERKGFTEPYLSFDQWEGLLDEVHQEQPGLIEASWVWPRKRTQDPSPCLPNPRHRPEQPLASPALRELSVPAELFASYWQDKASGRAGAEDAGWYFSGRGEAMRQLSAFLGEGRGTLVVTGAAGSGKSALLARVVTLSDPLFLGDPRSAAWVQGVAPQERPRAGAVNAAVLARGKTSLDLLVDLLDACGAPPLTPNGAPVQALLARLEALARDGDVAVVIDGLDEAQDPFACLSDVVLPLARLRDSERRSMVRLLVGVRSSPLVGSAVEQLRDERADALLDTLLQALDDDREPVEMQVLRTDGPECQDDIAAYAHALLLGSASSPYRDADAAGAAARTIASVTVPSFLDARLAADQLRTADEVQDLGDQAWLGRLAAGTIALLSEDLRDVACTTGVPAEALLAALRATAFAFGAGLPWDKVWPAAAQAVLTAFESGTGLPWDMDRSAWNGETLDAAIRTIGSSRLDGYLARSQEDGRTVYRLVHQRVVEKLRSSPASFTTSQESDLPSPEVGAEDQARQTAVAHARITDALARLVRDDPNHTAHPYIRRHLVAHADAGHVLLDEAVPPQLLAQETSLTLRSRLKLPLPAETPSRRHLTATALIEPYITPFIDRDSRADSIDFHKEALQERTAESRLNVATLPWEAATNVLASPSGHVTTLTCLDLGGGRALLAAGTREGAHVWDADSGQHLVDLDVGLVHAMCPIRSHSGRAFLAVVGVRGAGIYDPLSGLRVAQTAVGRFTAVQVLEDGHQRWRLLLRGGHFLAEWRPDFGSELTVLPYEGLRATAFRTGDRGDLVAYESADGVRVSDPDGNDIVRQPLGLSADRSLIRIPRTGTADLLVAVSKQRPTTTWDPLNGHVRQIPRGRPAYASAVPDATGRVALAGLKSPHTAAVWEYALDTWRLAALVEVGTVTALTALPSREDKWRLATAGDDGIRLWEAPRTSDPVAERAPLERGVQGMRVVCRVGSARHGKAWAFATEQEVRVLRHDDLHPVRTLDCQAVHNIFPVAPVRRPELLAVQTESELKVWDIDTDEIATAVPLHVGVRTRTCAIEFPSGLPGLCMALSPEAIIVHPVFENTEAPAAITSPGWPVTALTAIPSADGSLLATGSRSGRVWVRELFGNSGEVRLTTRSTSTVRSLCTLQSESRVLLAAADNHAIHLWDCANWHLVAKIATDGTKALGCLPRPDGTSVLASGDGHSVRLWDPLTGTLLHTLITAAPVSTLASRTESDGLLAFAGTAGLAVRDFSAFLL